VINLRPRPSGPSGDARRNFEKRSLADLQQQIDQRRNMIPTPSAVPHRISHRQRPPTERNPVVRTLEGDFCHNNIRYLAVGPAHVGQSAGKGAPSSFSRASVRCLPIENPPCIFGRVSDLIKYYSAPNTKCIERSSDKQSLSRHHAAFYAQARMCNLTAEQVLKSLFDMIEPQSLAGKFFFAEIDRKVHTLTEVFEKL